MFEPIYKNLLNIIDNGDEAIIITFMDASDKKSGKIKNKIIASKDNLKEVVLDPLLVEKSIESFETGKPVFIENKIESILIEPFFPEPRLIILGGGHIAKPLSEFGTKVGFGVVVVDDRPFFANKNRFPEAEVICDDFESSFKILNIKKSDFIVIVTRGHRHDGVCLRNALSFDSKYIGMIGSKRRVKGMMEELLSEGYSQDILDEIYSPIGLHIGAVTPDEIAVSIIAEIISVRRNGRDGKKITKSNWPEFDHEVVSEIIKQDEPKALITIMSSKGSVPRKAGAKMITWYDGRTMGSIGGGCAEGEVITKARDLILEKGYEMVHVDMTGEVAEDAGMVCGGTMEVLIECF